MADQVSVVSVELELRIGSFQTQLTILHFQFTTVRLNPVLYAIGHALCSST
jgi:hypothetical protein